MRKKNEALVVDGALAKQGDARNGGWEVGERRWEGSMEGGRGWALMFGQWFGLESPRENARDKQPGQERNSPQGLAGGGYLWLRGTCCAQHTWAAGKVAGPGADVPCCGAKNWPYVLPSG